LTQCLIIGKKYCFKTERNKPNQNYTIGDKANAIFSFWKTFTNKKFNIKKIRFLNKLSNKSFKKEGEKQNLSPFFFKKNKNL